jgi:thioredoxin
MSEAFQITADNFDALVLNAETPVLVDFWAPWCMPCRMLAPVVDEIAETYQGRMAVGKINIDDCPALAQKYGVMSIPTVVLFKAGQAVEKTVGVQPKEQLEQIILKHI